MELSARACRHCGYPISSTRGWFCSDRCRMRAYRRRKAGLAEDVYPGPGGARRGNVALAHATAAERARAWAGIGDQLGRLRW